MNYYIDTEFIESGPSKPIHLISIGIVSEDGREYYAENVNAPTQLANNWVKQNVLSQTIHFGEYCDCDGRQYQTLQPNPYRAAGNMYVDYLPKSLPCPAISLNSMAQEIKDFVAGTEPAFYGYFADYDWVVFCQIFGTMMDLPEGFPMLAYDLRQLLDMKGLKNVSQPDDMPHNALSDAHWIRTTFLEVGNDQGC